MRIENGVVYFNVDIIDKYGDESFDRYAIVLSQIESINYNENNKLIITTKTNNEYEFDSSYTDYKTLCESLES